MTQKSDIFTTHPGRTSFISLVYQTAATQYKENNKATTSVLLIENKVRRKEWKK